MQAMLVCIRKKDRRRKHVVIIDDINRLSRGVVVHWQLRQEPAKAGGIPESPSLEFGDDSDSVLIENMLAPVAQHQRQKNAEQTKSRMRARVMNGYCVLSRPPKGFEYEQAPRHRKLLVRSEPVASIIQVALEGYANGRFQTQVELKRFLEGQPAYPKDLPDGTICNQRVHDLLTQPLYAGYVETPSSGVPLCNGHHESLVSFETFKRIQKRLSETAKAPACKNINADFPLRGFVNCDDCDKPMTSCWSKSKTGAKRPYYMCKTEGCESYRKSIRRDELEGEFEAVLESLQPTKGWRKPCLRSFRISAPRRQRSRPKLMQIRPAREKIRSKRFWIGSWMRTAMP